MFKKLKQKINEEQSPQRNAQALQQQAQVGTGDQRGRASSLRQDEGQAATCDRENVSKSITASPSLDGNANGNENASPQSFAQKLQLKVPSMESLFRSPVRGDGLFRTPSRENLTRSASRDSLNRLGENEPLGTPAYDPPSDIESEAEDLPSSVDALSKDQLLHRFHQVERSLGNYRGKYSELVTAYRTVQREKEKTQAILSQSQDKALRRISELREELQMDQQAKKHLQAEFEAALEEKDQMITVLQTQVALMKKRLPIPAGGILSEAAPTEGSPEAESAPTEESQMAESAPQSPSKDMNSETPVLDVEGDIDPAKRMEALQQRVRRQENLLQRCKELLHTHKERSAQLGSENETLQNQLQERLQELEKMKELHTTEKTRLITQLRDAKNLIEQLEQDKGMVIAETKRQMHETLEMKEEEIAQLRSRIQQGTAQRDELQEQKEKSEKAAFEELERALGVAQRAEEGRRQLQARLEEQVKDVERANEEERRNLQQELSRVKQEVVNIMKKSSEDRVAELERLHAEALASKEQELHARLQDQEARVQEQISQAVEGCRKELTGALQEKDQQAALALEEVELQKTALQMEGQSHSLGLQQELEAARTKVLELESSLMKSSQDKTAQSSTLSEQMEEQRRKYVDEMSTLEEKHREEVEALGQALKQLQDQHHAELEAAMKEKEQQFQAHVEDMNLKTLEKLDVKQTELESLSLELSELLRSKELLEEQLEAARQELGMLLQQEHSRYKEEIEGIKSQHEQSLGGVEKTLKEELNKLKMVLEDKDKALEELLVRGKDHKEVEKALQEGKVQLEQLAVSHCKEMEEWQEQSKVMRDGQKTRDLELEELRQSLQKALSEKEVLLESRAQLNEATAELERCRSQVKGLEQQLQETQNVWAQKTDSLQHKYSAEQQKLQHQAEQAKIKLSEQERSFTVKLNSQRQEEEQLRKKLEEEAAAVEKRLEVSKQKLEERVKMQDIKMEKNKQKFKEMQEKMKKRLQEQEERLKEELKKKDTELSLKELQVKEKILEMAQVSSTGISDAVSQLEASHQEQLGKMQLAHQKEQEEQKQNWQRKLGLQEEEVQEKAQEMVQLAQQLEVIREEKEQVLQEMKDLREDLAMRETTVQKLQAELREAAVTLESLSQGKTMLQAQVETMEKNLNQAMNESNAVQDQMSKAEDEHRGKVLTLSKQLEDTRSKLNVFEASSSKESEDLHKRLEQSVLQIKTTEDAFHSQICMISEQLVRQCTEVQTKMEGSTNELHQTVDGRVSALLDRVMCSQKWVAQLKNVILIRTNRIRSLEEQLQKKNQENSGLISSLEQRMLQVNANAEHIKALTSEKESLQKDGNCTLQTLSEKDLCIEQMRKDNIALSNDLKANSLCISSLESVINDLEIQVKSALTGKEEVMSLHTEEQRKLLNQTEELLKTVEIQNKEKSSAVEQAEQFKNKLSEFKERAESKFIQNHNTIEALKTKLGETEKHITERDDRLEALASCIDTQATSKGEADQALNEKEQSILALIAELKSCTGRIAELEEELAEKTKECTQLNSDLQQQSQVGERDRRDLEQQLQQVQAQSSQHGVLAQETQKQLQSLVKETQTAHHALERQREDFEMVKADILRDRDEVLRAAEEKLSSESTGRRAELKKKAEQKIAMVRKQLTTQLEEKEQCMKALEMQLEEIKQHLNTREGHIKVLEEQVQSLKEVLTQKDELQKQGENERGEAELEKERALQGLREMYEEKLCALQKEVTSQEEMIVVIQERGREKLSSQDEANERLEEALKKLKQAEDEKDSYQAEMNRLNAHLFQQVSHSQEQKEMTETPSEPQGQKQAMEEKQKQKKGCLEEERNSMEEIEAGLANQQDPLKQCRDSFVEAYERKLQDVQKQLEERESLLRAYEEESPQKVATDPEGLLSEMRAEQKDLLSKLSEAETEKQKLRKAFNSLQKDLRSLRKEHQLDLEYVKKEMTQEYDKKLKLEIEDIEMKHSSGLKQIMREFNTHIATKEQELDAGVREVVAKAQEVEVELMENHREEASQLQKIINQKESELKRTVQRYEEILQSREEEMGARVWEVQKELEEVEQRSQHSTQGSVTELQVQLAQKTTLLSEARLKEQEFQELIHTLEDKVRCLHKNSVVTHLGSTYGDAVRFSCDALAEPTELEYLRKVLFEYMMGRETKTMAKVITSVLKFPPDQAQTILEKEDSRMPTWLR